jgi:hypothetical protein
MRRATQRAALQPRCPAPATPTARRKDRVGQSPPTKEDGPLGGGRPENTSAAAKQAGSALASVRPAVRNRRYPAAASASLYEPACERTWWWLSVRCPHCGSVHLHRVRREEDAGGARRTGCGRRVFVTVRRTYRSTASRRAT